jgi:hypothetical protein
MSKHFRKAQDPQVAGELGEYKEINSKLH